MINTRHLREALRLSAVACIFVLIVGTMPASAQTAKFTYDDGIIWMTGEIDTSTPDDLLRVLNAHPEVKWIVMEYVPGSNDDDANLKAARIIRERGMNTGVPSDGLIASGGTDFFLAGIERTVQRGACIGVHSWSDDGDPTPPTQLPRDHVGHQMFLDYMREISIPEKFYWYTIEAAPADGMHYMSEADIQSFGLATEFEGNDPWDLASCKFRGAPQ